MQSKADLEREVREQNEAAAKRLAALRAIAERPLAGKDDGTKEDFRAEMNSMIETARAALPR